jgi:hypothetical protein
MWINKNNNIYKARLADNKTAVFIGDMTEDDTFFTRIEKYCNGELLMFIVKDN